jgi:hypothetical protein
MKKLGIILIALTILVVGLAMADAGVNQVNEVQGLSTSTTVIAAGNFNAASSVDLKISSTIPLTSIPGAEWSTQPSPPTLGNVGATIYQTVYTEDTQNSDVGYISYDKDLDLSTANKISGQYNVQAVKQITYLGVDASSVVTNDYMLLDGAGWPGYSSDRIICPFGSNYAYPAFCNRVETGSAMNLKVANLNTQMGDRFIMKAADPGVEVYNNVGVGAYTADLPSQGSVSAYIKGSIKEGGKYSEVGYDYLPPVGDSYGPFSKLHETVVFSDTTGVSGVISTFAKSMRYNSVLDFSSDIPLPSG